MLGNAVQVSVNQLRIGMFVAELDRGWRETPFLLQGFHVASVADIDALKRECGKVVKLPRPGCDVIQGYYTCRPMPLASVEDWWRDKGGRGL